MDLKVDYESCGSLVLLRVIPYSRSLILAIFHDRLLKLYVSGVQWIRNWPNAFWNWFCVAPANDCIKCFSSWCIYSQGNRMNNGHTLKVVHVSKQITLKIMCMNRNLFSSMLPDALRYGQYNFFSLKKFTATLLLLFSCSQHIPISKWWYFQIFLNYTGKVAWHICCKFFWIRIPGNYYMAWCYCIYANWWVWVFYLLFAPPSCLVGYRFIGSQIINVILVIMVLVVVINK